MTYRDDDFDEEDFWEEVDPHADTDFEGPLYHEYVKVDDYRGIAFFVQSYTEGGCVRVTMVGDDRNFFYEPEEVELLPRKDFCGECGQIGCTHDGLERDG